MDPDLSCCCNADPKIQIHNTPLGNLKVSTNTGTRAAGANNPGITIDIWFIFIVLLAVIYILPCFTTGRVKNNEGVPGGEL